MRGSTRLLRPSTYAYTTPPRGRDRVLWIGRSVESRADAKRGRSRPQRPRSARDSGAAHRDAAGSSAWRHRAAGAHGNARCHGDERRHARHDPAPVGSPAPGNAAHPVVLRRRADAARAREREGPRDSIRARAGRHSQIPARSPDVRPQVPTQSRHRRVHARQGRAVPRRDPPGRDASWRNGAAPPAAGPESGTRRKRAVARGAGASRGGRSRDVCGAGGKRPRSGRAADRRFSGHTARGSVEGRIRAGAVQSQRLRRGYDAAEHGRQLGVPQHAFLSRLPRLRLGHSGGVGLGRLARRRLSRARLVHRRAPSSSSRAPRATGSPR